MTIATAANTSIHPSFPAAGVIGLAPRVVPALPGIPANTLAAAYADCRSLTRQRARNFYYGLRLTPEPRRSAIYSIYAWMRHADDEVDAGGPPPVRRERLARYRQLTDAALAGRAPGRDQPSFWAAFTATVVSYRLDAGLFHDMLAGLEEDIAHEGYQTEAELQRYCYRVASTVGLVCVAIWGTVPDADPQRVRELALGRGQAFQRTNILRDFAQDYDANPSRIYLPRDSFHHAGLTTQDVRAWADPERCRRFILAHAARARAEYTASAPLDGMIDPACRPTLWAMTRIYAGLLTMIETNPVRIVSKRRVRLPAARKAGIALTATLRARIGRW